mmetsp:Transcript_22905/g.49545  ORF Transcript_22905/g.49545 Transcript_22905/m.49545 type:complete len:147 (-) Transcript_22905:913-1353(-)
MDTTIDLSSPPSLVCHDLSASSNQQVKMKEEVIYSSDTDSSDGAIDSQNNKKRKRKEDGKESKKKNKADKEQGEMMEPKTNKVLLSTPDPSKHLGAPQQEQQQPTMLSMDCHANIWTSAKWGEHNIWDSNQHSHSSRTSSRWHSNI